MNISPEEFKRYAKGEASPLEKGKIESWLNQQEDGGTEATGEDEQLAAVWRKLSATAGIEDEITNIRGGRSLRKGRLIMLSKIAACFVFAMGIGWLVKDYFIKPTVLEAAPMKTVRTEAGQRMNITLPDGSKVLLNAESELEFPEAFTADNRLVTLNGEAFFDVAHDKSKPFIVHTDSSYTKVLGTQFNLSAYGSDAKAVLTVERGKVMFGRHDSKEQVVLTVGMQGTLAYNKGVTSQTVQPEQESAWKERVLQLSNEPLSEVAKKIERWYGVSIKIKSENLKSLTVTGSYREKSLEQVLSSLEFTTGLKYEIKDKVVTITE
ncbi:FecR family protein [Sphingobacterium psychroaquaticum]|uniref:FecR family protein n=1 Tax=Sphingobacterium psychroaquaticum TaxID=561061 RepID=A0A1X7HV30_9SPHI|nr:FecR domain-containing protein [Sphingobacterium psychroaquaticum]SMG05844.1 FecR family protein [Sphingobacterium psychroaquaticum]